MKRERERVLCLMLKDNNVLVLAFAVTELTLWRRGLVWLEGEGLGTRGAVSACALPWAGT